MRYGIVTCEEINKDAIMYINEWKRSRRTYLDTSILIERLDSLIYDLHDKKERSQKVINRYKNEKNNLYLTSFSYALDILNDQIFNIFTRNVRQAIESSKEYDYPPFRSGLEAGFSNPKLISVKPLSKNSGLNFQSSVNINMDKVYGRLDDYGKAITAARNDQGIGKTKIATASATWHYRIYAVDREGRSVVIETKRGASDITHKYAGKYTATVGLRVANSIGLAPWWKLLDKGNINIKIPGNQRPGGGAGRGTPYPEVSATNFVEKSKSEISLIVEDTWRAHFRETLDTINTAIVEIQNDMNLIPKLISHLQNVQRIVSQKIVETDPVSILTRLVEKRTSRYNTWNILSEGDIFQISNEIYQIISSGEESTYIRFGGRRMRIKSIINKFNEQIRKLRGG